MLPSVGISSEAVEFLLNPDGYVVRRTPGGKTSREIKRCLTRDIARDLYRLLENGLS